MIPKEFNRNVRANVPAEGSGGADGIVLPLNVIGDSIYDIAYTIEASVGSAGQNLYLQVDTGSSDLWIASKSCSSSLCGQTNGHLYDPSSSTPTGQNFNIDYLKGKVSGPVVWDKFSLGGYSLDSQALAAADSITFEPLSPTFSGILGLALPLNSIIAELIPPVTSNSPDGAAWASNLFSITPRSSAPSARFLSLLLSRPGSDTVPAQLGIGRHPSFVSDPSAVEYASLESEREGTLFWKVGVRAITVWVNGEQMPVQIGRSSNGALFPSAVLDSGVPLIFTTSAVANGIYGAIGIGPGSDGQYYVPCTTPLNITITLDDRTPIPLHPLDLTAKPMNDNTASSCIGLIQSADSVLAQPTSLFDIILGVPFLRNTYTVMTYEPPTDSGAFDTSNNASAAGDIKPQLGLIGITDPVKALDEFNTVRVLNKPISSSSGSGSGSAGDSGSSSSNGGGTTLGQHLSVGIIVLVSLLGFFALCLCLFGIRWCLTRRRFHRTDPSLPSAGAGAVFAGIGRATEKEDEYAYALASVRGSRDMGSKVQPGKELYADEETIRSARWEPYMQDHGLLDLGLGSPGKLEHEEHEGHHEEGDGDGDLDREMGLRERRNNEGWSDGDDTLVVGGRGEIIRTHERTLSTGTPLLHEINLERARSTSSGSGRSWGRSDEFGVNVVPYAHDIGRDVEGGEGGDRTSMAGVGTVARGGKMRPWRDVSGSGQQMFELEERKDVIRNFASEGGDEAVFRRMSAGSR
ncbi:hypothetical protein C0995_004714 [Termitomyces sp. Mi166|nr:hypothetical protein C0995_004714 [Termitomyces sp. Mi166\